jgi:hypothetical protein
MYVRMFIPISQNQLKIKQFAVTKHAHKQIKLIRSKLQYYIFSISAQQTVAPDAVTRVFPSVGGYKEFAPTIIKTQTRISPGAQFFTPAYHFRSVKNFSTRPDQHSAGAGEPGSWAAEQIQTIFK